MTDHSHQQIPDGVRLASDPFRGALNAIPAEHIDKALQFMQGEAPLPYPISVQLDLTLRCTAKCLHCQQWTWPSHPELSFSEIRQLIDMFERWGVRTLTISGGNPFLHADFDTTIVTARQAGIHVGILTEGPPPDTLMAEAVGRYADWIRFSIDGPSAALHDKIRNAPGLFARATASAAALKKSFPRLKVGFSCVIQRLNIHHLEGMLSLAERLGLDAVSFKLPHGADPSAKFLPRSQEWEHFFAWLGTGPQRKYDVRSNLDELRLFIRAFSCENDLLEGKPVRSHYTRHAVKCFAPLFHVIVDSEGFLYPCCYLHYDNRLWKGVHAPIRQQFRLGNLLADEDETLAKLASAMLGSIGTLPTNGHAACGNCTRHCGLNSSMTRIEKRVPSEENRTAPGIQTEPASAADTRPLPFL